jgi:hypothetical protein
MLSPTTATLGALFAACLASVAPPPYTWVAASPLAQAGTARSIDLAQALSAKKVRVVNRDVTPLAGDRPGVHLSEREGVGLLWLTDSAFGEGTVQVDVRGRDVLQKSFLGVAFHGKDDNTYECVYLRPFNFRATDPDRHQHAVQYMAAPDYDWPRLRKEFPEEFENPVDQALDPAGWVTLRVVVQARAVQIFAGAAAKAPTLEVRRLGTSDTGMIGLWVGNNSDGDFANLRVTSAK